MQEAESRDGLGLRPHTLCRCGRIWNRKSGSCRVLLCFEGCGPVGEGDRLLVRVDMSMKVEWFGRSLRLEI